VFSVDVKEMYRSIENYINAIEWSWIFWSKVIGRVLISCVCIIPYQTVYREPLQKKNEKNRKRKKIVIWLCVPFVCENKKLIIWINS
jgi:hypothetical protein